MSSGSPLPPSALARTRHGLTRPSHVHHYLIGFIASIFCVWDHWISLFVLAFTVGIMVQGMAAYTYVSMFALSQTCQYFTDPDQATTTAYAASPTAALQATPYRVMFCLTTEPGGAALGRTSYPGALDCNGTPWPNSL